MSKELLTPQQKMEMESKALLSTVEYTVNGEVVKLSGNIVKNFLVSGNGKISDEEIVLFMKLCQYQKLNPFLKEAYLVKFGDKPAQMITSKEAFMKRAESHPQYDGFKAGIIVDRKGVIEELEGSFMLPTDKLLGGWSIVYKKDRKMPYVNKISFIENTKGQSTWNTMPALMIRKTAMVQTLREAFPETLGSLYTEEDNHYISQDVKNNAIDVEQEIKQNANTGEIIDFAVPKKEVRKEVKQQEIIDVEDDEFTTPY